MPHSVYVFLDERDQPYYVGKTNNMTRRRKEHLYEIRMGNDLPKYQKARALMKKGFKFKMKRVFQFRTEEAAYAKEKELITMYRRKPGISLMNLTTGGKNERPTDFSGKPRKSSWYTPPKKAKKITKKVVRKKINVKRKRKA